MSNLTTSDNYQTADERSVAQVSKQYSLTLSGSTAAFKQLPFDVKSAKIKASGADVQFWLSYNDGANDYLADGGQTTPTKANASANDMLKDVDDKETFLDAQNQEFNRIHAEITSGSGNATLLIWPGGGKANGL